MGWVTEEAMIGPAMGNFPFTNWLSNVSAFGYRDLFSFPLTLPTPPLPTITPLPPPPPPPPPPPGGGIMQVVFDGGTNDDIVVMGIIAGASNDCCCCGFEATTAVAAATAAAAEEDANVLKSAAYSISIGGISIKVEGGILG